MGIPLQLNAETSEEEAKYLCNAAMNFATQAEVWHNEEEWLRFYGMTEIFRLLLERIQYILSLAAYRQAKLGLHQQDRLSMN